MISRTITVNLAYHMKKKICFPEKRTSQTHRCWRKSLPLRPLPWSMPIQPLVLGTKKLPPFSPSFSERKKLDLVPTFLYQIPCTTPTRFNMEQVFHPIKIIGKISGALAHMDDTCCPYQCFFGQFFFPWQIVIYLLRCQEPGGREIGSFHHLLENEILLCIRTSNGL